MAGNERAGARPLLDISRQGAAPSIVEKRENHPAYSKWLTFTWGSNMAVRPYCIVFVTV